MSSYTTKAVPLVFPDVPLKTEMIRNVGKVDVKSKEVQNSLSNLSESSVLSKDVEKLVSCDLEGQIPNKDNPVHLWWKSSL